MSASPLVEIAFGLSAGAILLSSLAVVLIKNPVRATMLLIASFIPTSLVYILLQASFVGILQILVYAGAIMMLFTFVIMMINPSPQGGESPVTGGSDDGHSGLTATLFGLVVLGGLGVLLIPKIYRAASQVSTEMVSKPGFGSLNSIADLIFKDPANNPLTVSFELISFLILVGIIAALNFSRRKGSAGIAGTAMAANGKDSISTRPTETLPIVKHDSAMDIK